MGLERMLRGISQDSISNPTDPKLHRYNIFNIELLEGKKKHAFKDHCSKDYISIFKGKYPTTRCWFIRCIFIDNLNPYISCQPEVSLSISRVPTQYV